VNDVLIDAGDPSTALDRWDDGIPSADCTRSCGMPSKIVPITLWWMKGTLSGGFDGFAAGRSPANS
jgi:hypothetical protein